MTGQSRFLRAAAAALLLLPAAAVFSAIDESEMPADVSLYPDARALLDQVTGSLPDVPIKVKARLQSRSRDGEIEKELNTEMNLDWRGRPPTARYAVRDAFGGTLAELDITWRADGTTQCRYREGDPPAAAPLPDLDGAIEGTDISWTDLSLSFLWWGGGRTVGSETIKGRFCYIVELPAPAPDEGTYAGVRLWIDPQIHILLEAAAYDRQGQLLRLLEVKSFKKIGQVWVIQNLDVQSFPARHKTSLRVQQVEGPGVGDAQETAPGDARGEK